MKQKVKISICLTLLIMFVSIITAKDTLATVRLFDGQAYTERVRKTGWVL